MSKGIPILTYNGFYSKSKQSISGIYISIKAFAEQMEYLHNNGYTCITLEDAETAYKRNDFDDKTFCITFDNGLFSQYKYAIPILNKYSWKATFFVPTLAIGEKKHKKLTDTFGLDILPTDKMMDWKQLEVLVKKDHFVQSQGYSHHRDCMKSNDRIEVEVFESKHVLENMLGYEIEYFAFPFGTYNTYVIQNLKQANYQMSFSNFPGVLTSSTDIYRTPRIAVHNEDTIEIFKNKLTTGYSSTSKAMFSRARAAFAQVLFFKDAFSGILKRIGLY